MWKLNWTELGIDWDRLKDVLTYDSTQPMIFSSGLFLFLFLGFSLVYLLLQKKTTARLLFVTLFSYYFYYKSSGFYFFLLGIVTVSDSCWPAGWRSRCRHGNGKCWWCAACVSTLGCSAILSTRTFSMRCWRLCGTDSSSRSTSSCR